jgi:hypothetical protein
VPVQRPQPVVVHLQAAVRAQEGEGVLVACQQEEKGSESSTIKCLKRPKSQTGQCIFG